MVAFKMCDSVPSARYSSVCNVLHQWRIWLIPTYKVYRLYDMVCISGNEWGLKRFWFVQNHSNKKVIEHRCCSWATYILYITLYNILYITLYNILYITLYNILYITLYNILYITLYNILYITLHNILYITLYNILYITLHNILYITLYNILYITLYNPLALFRLAARCNNIVVYVLATVWWCGRNCMLWPVLHDVC